MRQLCVIVSLVSCAAFGQVALPDGYLSPTPPTQQLGLRNTPLATTATMNLFVDAATGNDANGCTTNATACLTIQAALDKVPRFIQNPVTITVDAGTFSGGYVEGFNFIYSSKISVDGLTPTASTSPALTIQGTMQAASITGLQTGTVASATAGGTIGGGGPGTWATVSVTAAGWNTNALAGLQFCITGGTGSGQCRIIDSNTNANPGVATIAGRWVTTPDGTSTFSINTWGTTINTTTSREVGAWGSNVFPASGNGTSAFFVRTIQTSAVPQVVIKNMSFASSNGGGAVQAEGGSTYVLIQGNQFTNSVSNAANTGVFDFELGASGLVESNQVTLSFKQRCIRTGGVDFNQVQGAGVNWVYADWNRFSMGASTSTGMQLMTSSVQSVQNLYSSGQRGLFIGPLADVLSAGDHFSGGQTTGAFLLSAGYGIVGDSDVSVDGDTIDGASGTGVAVDMKNAGAKLVFASDVDVSTVTNWTIAYRLRGTNTFIGGDGVSIPTPSGSVTTDIQFTALGGTTTNYAFATLSGATPKMIYDSATNQRIIDQ